MERWSVRTSGRPSGRSVRGVLSASAVALVVLGQAAGTAGAATAPDTTVTAGPAAVTSATTATFAFTSTITPATFTCRLDTGTASSCTSPKTYSGLAAGTHSFTVAATAGGATDATPASATWTVDTTAPTVPTGLAAVPATPTSSVLEWSASTDANGVAGYDVYRDSALVASPGNVLTYTDATVVAGTTHTYAVRARDVAGNVSALTTAVTAVQPVPYSPHLTRAPYLTDLVGLHATVNFGTDRSSNVAAVTYGPAGTGSTCTLNSTVVPSHLSLSMNGTVDYQWKATLTLPSAGTWCYRITLAGTDLLGSNPTPRFTTQVAVGSTETYSFDVFGDWGKTDANGINPGQAALDKLIGASGARFAVTTGDNAYPAGSQNNYGDLQTVGADVGGVFGRPYWAAAGGQLATFAALGNHGILRSDAVHPQFTVWPEDAAVAGSAGRYQSDLYASVNGSNAETYPSTWYAFNAGTARFYVLDAAWNDPNVGTATAYANEAAAHWSTSSPQYQWLKADLAAHPSGLKFAFFHYPTYSDTSSVLESSDTALQGSAGLEGLLSQYGVSMTFSGHAHVYQRSSGLGGMPEYTTGGGGAVPEALSATCTSNDRYAVGWSSTTGTGSACGSATAPTSPNQVYHFLKVTVAGNQVTVTPTNANGATFDVQTYTFSPKPDTYIDSGPPAGTTSSSATFAFHASGSSPTFTCSLDGAKATACTSPVTYTGLTQKAHTFSVAATVNKVVDPVPATATWTVDATAPTAPSGLTAAPNTAFGIQLAWTAGTDNLRVTAYNVYRDGVLLTSIPAGTTYTDGTVFLSSTHTYAVQAVDIAGNTSAKSNTATATTPSPVPAVFSDGFETGDLSAWTASSGLVAQTSAVRAGTYAVEGSTTNGATYAKETLPSTYTDAYARVWFNALGANDTIGLLRLRDAAGNSLGYVYEESTGQLGFHNDATGTSTLSTTVVEPGWHALELHRAADTTAGPTGTVEVWFDNARVADLSGTAVDTGLAPVGIFQIGEAQTGRTYDVAFDDAAFGTSRLGPISDTTPPTAPASLTAVASSPFSVALTWSASTDNLAVTGYDILRDGSLLTHVGVVTAYTDPTVAAGSTHSYAVRATDQANNASALSPWASATTATAPPPLFSDGFETGSLANWTTAAGLVAETTDVRSGTWAAEGSTTTGATYAKKTLPSTYTNGYARVGFEIKSQANQVNLLRLRDAAGNSIGYVYVTTTGYLYFHNDATGANTTSTTTVGSGWHLLELHIGLNGTASTVEVWLDGVQDTGLSTTAATTTATSIGQLQIGDTGSGTWDVVYDDAAFGTSRIGY